MGLVALQHVEPSQTRDGIHVPRPGIEPVSPVLAGGFLSTASPGKPPSSFFRPVSVLGTRGIALALGQYQPCGVGKGQMWRHP